MSTGMGLAGLTLAEPLNRTLSLHSSGLVRAVALRDAVVGLGLLAGRRPGTWLAARVAGDLMDVVLFAAGAAGAKQKAPWLLGAVAAAICLSLDARVLRAERTPPGLPPLKGMPQESWRGSGLAEDVGSAPHEAEPGDPLKAEKVRAAERALGLPSVR